MLLNFDHVFDTLTPSKSKPLKHILETFCMTNLVNKPTCYTKNGNPSCIGVILTNPPKLFCNTTVINCLVVSSLREQQPITKNKQAIFRSYKNFDEYDFNKDLSRVPFHVAHIFDDVDDIYYVHESLLKDIINEHA